MNKITTLLLFTVAFVFVSCNGNSTDITKDEHKIYDKATNEFYVYDFPVSAGAGSLLNELHNDGWVIETLEKQDDWYKNPLLNYETVHWALLGLPDTLSVMRYLEINHKLFGNLNLYDKWTDPNNKDTLLYNQISEPKIKLSWSQNGQIHKISAINHYGVGCLKERNKIFDSIFPDKIIANKSFGYFEFFGVKNVHVYVTDIWDEYTFDAVPNEKYKYSVDEVLEKFEYKND